MIIMLMGPEVGAVGFEERVLSEERNESALQNAKRSSRELRQENQLERAGSKNYEHLWNGESK